MAHQRRLRDDVEAADRGRAAASGCSTVLRMRRAVVLPAPFGPKQAVDLAGRRVEADAVQRDELAAAQIGVGLREIADMNHARSSRPMFPSDVRCRRHCQRLAALQLGPRLIAYLMRGESDNGPLSDCKSTASRIGRRRAAG